MSFPVSNGPVSSGPVSRGPVSDAPVSSAAASSPNEALPPLPPAREPEAPAPLWLQRSSLVIFVLFCFYIGAILALLPWQPHFWDENGWLMAHPAIDALMIRGWVRGLITGIGLVDVWIGISELIHYRDVR